MTHTFPTLPTLTHLPKLVIFDLDYTLWPLYIDCHSRGHPYTYHAPSNTAYDRASSAVPLFPSVPHVFTYLSSTLQVQLSIASRTSTPDRAWAVLQLLRASDGQPLSNHLTQPQMYPGSKLAHMRALHTATGVAYRDMLFFDDESRNKDVEKLGVTFVLVDDWEGVTEEAVCRGLIAFDARKRQAEGMERFVGKGAAKGEVNLKKDDPDTKGKRPKRKAGM